MILYPAIVQGYSVIIQYGNPICFPLIRNQNGTEKMYSVSPIHGRSYVVGRTDEGRFVVSKGNGLAYSKHLFLHTPEAPSDVWGLLMKEEALRDFHCGQDVQAWGIKTNQMECGLSHPYRTNGRRPKTRFIAV